MTNSISKKDMLRYVISQGIPVALADISLLEYGGMGKYLRDNWVDFEKRQTLLKKKVFNIYKSDGNSGLFYAFLRSIIVHQLSTKIFDINDWERMHSEDIEEAFSNKFIGIPHFYSFEFTEIFRSDRERFSFESDLQKHIEYGGWLVLQSTNCIKECTWYTESFRRALTEHGVDLKDESRGKLPAEDSTGK